MAYIKRQIRQRQPVNESKMIEPEERLYVTGDISVEFTQYGDLFITSYRKPSQILIPKRAAIEIASLIINQLEGVDLEQVNLDKIKRIRNVVLQQKKIQLGEDKNE